MKTARRIRDSFSEKCKEIKDLKNFRDSKDKSVESF